ncbi:hypothetical protein DF186_18245, partial [Enterococcus hirae]
MAQALVDRAEGILDEVGAQGQADSGQLPSGLTTRTARAVAALQAVDRANPTSVAAAAAAVEAVACHRLATRTRIRVLTAALRL